MSRRGRILQVWIDADALDQIRARASAETYTVARWVRRELYKLIGLTPRADGGIAPSPEGEP